MSCNYHPEYNPESGEVIGTIDEVFCVRSGKCTEYGEALCPYCLVERVRYLKAKLEDNEECVRFLKQDIRDHQYAGSKLADVLSKRRKVIEELKQRVLDEQSAFDKMEELYLQERESFRVLASQLGDEVSQSAHHFSRASRAEKREEVLHKMLKEVVFQLEGLVQFISEDDYLDNEVEVLYDTLMKDAWKVLGSTPCEDQLPTTLKMAHKLLGDVYFDETGWRARLKIYMEKHGR